MHANKKYYETTITYNVNIFHFSDECPGTGLIIIAEKQNSGNESS